MLWALDSKYVAALHAEYPCPRGRQFVLHVPRMQAHKPVQRDACCWWQTRLAAAGAAPFVKGAWATRETCCSAFAAALLSIAIALYSLVYGTVMAPPPSFKQERPIPDLISSIQDCFLMVSKPQPTGPRWISRGHAENKHEFSYHTG